MIYYLLGEEWKEYSSAKVDVKVTPKSITIIPISERPPFTNGCIDQLWDKGKIIIREPKDPHKRSRHYLKNWGDGCYTLYPDRAGIPYVMIPADNGLVLKIFEEVGWD